MITEKLPWLTEAESANTSSLKSQFLQSLKSSDEYRYSFVEEKLQSGLAAQIRAIREQRQLDPKQFAEKLGKKVSWVYRLEDPNLPPPTIPSLLEIARAYDMDLEVRFRPFSAFCSLDEVDDLSTKSLEVASFKDELSELEREAALDRTEAECQRWLTAHAATHAPLGTHADYYKNLLPAEPVAWNSMAGGPNYLWTDVFETLYQNFLGDGAANVNQPVDIGWYRAAKKGPGIEIKEDFYDAKRGG